MRQLSVVLVLALFIGTVVCGCKYTYGDGQFSGGCTQNCRDFSTLADALNACDSDNSCGGVTYSYAAVGGSAAKNAIGNGWGYQLRASKSGAKSPNRENTWLKGQCPDPNTPNDPCDFQPAQGTYLSGCNNNCQDYANLNDALNACRNDASCGGVTFSRRDIGGSSARNAFDGVWGFQLRAGTQFINSPNGENSWGKTKCPVSNVNGPFCSYARQGYSQFNTLLNAATYADESSALNACDSRPDCTGVQVKNGQWNLASGASSPSTTASVAYTRGTCNVVSFPILFTGCNFTGERIELKQNIPSLDLKKYRSLYVPPGQYVRFWSKETYQGNYVDYKSSNYCSDAGFAVQLQLTSSNKSLVSLEVRSFAAPTAKKLKMNKKY